MYEPKAHLLAFVDALGFAREIQRTSSKPIEDYLRVLKSLKESWKTRQAKRALKLTTIGDSTILAIEIAGKREGNRLVPEDYNGFLDGLYNLTFAVAELQTGFALSNIWTRGAVTYDDVDFQRNDDRLLGPAFHRAYHLEATVAKVPRVIVDGRVIAAMGVSTVHEFIENAHEYRRDCPLFYDFSIQRPVTELHRDVPTFVDFAGWARSQVGGTMLLKLAEHVASRLKEDVEHFAKYRWLADYLSFAILETPIDEAFTLEQRDLHIRLLDES